MKMKLPYVEQFHRFKSQSNSVKEKAAGSNDKRLLSSDGGESTPMGEAISNNKQKEKKEKKKQEK